MSEQGRLERLEQRIATLETLVRQIVAAQAAPPTDAVPERAVPRRPAGSLRPPVPSPSAPASAPRRRPARPALRFDTETWIGERGLLAVGVIALILAAGYLLKLSFDRGWVSPVMRCIGGAAAGVTVGGIGWRLQARYRTYGAALVGCGAAIIYLAVWAAVREYGFLPPTSGIVALALVSLALASVAYALDVEALGATAAAGAFFAPIFLHPERGDADALLVYLATMAAALGVVAARRHWRLAASIIAASYFGLGWAGGGGGTVGATPELLLAYGVAGGTAGLFLGLRERWWEVRGLSFWGGWALIATSADAKAGLPLLVAAVVMAAPVWWHGSRTPRIWPEQSSPMFRGAEWSVGEALHFFVTPFFLAWAIHRQAPAYFDATRGLAALAVGIPYALAGYVRPRPAFALVGAAALGTAAVLHWPNLGAVFALLGLAMLWAALNHAFERSDGRWYALLTLTVAVAHLVGYDAIERGVVSHAFTDPWALALWATTSVTVLFALGLWRPVGAPADVAAVRAVLWIAGGALLLFGITGEIRRFFVQHTKRLAAAQLASGLSVSAWWLVFATALVVYGFARGSRAVRQFGLGVAALAGAKVLLVDLRSLDALYRVGSVFILGLMSLLVAYLYHLHAPRPLSPASAPHNAEELS